MCGMTLDPKVVDAGRKEFTRFAADLDHVRDAVPKECATIREGVGQFSHLVGPSADVFEASWLMVLRVASASAGTVADNMGAMTLDLSRLDNL